MHFDMPPQPERRDTAISVRVRPGERALLDQATRLTGLSQAELLVHLLRQFVEQHRQDTQATETITTQEHTTTTETQANVCPRGSSREGTGGRSDP